GSCPGIVAPSTITSLYHWAALHQLPGSPQIGKLGTESHLTGNPVISNEAGRCKSFSYAHQSRFERTSSSAQELRLVLELVFICVTLPCSALCVHQFGVAHQSSLRSSTTMMSFSISPFREAGSLINQPVTSHHNAVLASPHRHHHFSV